MTDCPRLTSSLRLPGSLAPQIRSVVDAMLADPRRPLSPLHHGLASALILYALMRKPQANYWWRLNIEDLARLLDFDWKDTEGLRTSGLCMLSVVLDWGRLVPMKKGETKRSSLFTDIVLKDDELVFRFNSRVYDYLVGLEGFKQLAARND